MKLTIHDALGNHADNFKKTLSRMPGAVKALNGVELRIGADREEGYGVDAGAAMSPSFVGDSAWVGDSIGLEAVEAIAQTNPEAVRFRHQWNEGTKRFDRIYSAPGVNDAAPNLVGAQLLSPASANWIPTAFKQVLPYSNFTKLVDVAQGDNPWASVQNLPTIGYGGAWPTLNMSGSQGNVDTFDQFTKTDAIVNQVVNMEATYSLKIEEAMRLAQGQSYPLAGQAMMEKQAYSNWSLDFFESVIGYYGNSGTGTLGLLNATTPVSWGGTSLTDIKGGASTTKGSLAYQAVANAIADFLTTNMNKPNLLRIAMSPLAYNILGSLPYSDAYSSVSALQALITNFDSGLGPKGTTPAIEIYADPLLAGSALNSFNSNVYDYLVITAPRIQGGTGEADQSLLLWGRPLDKLVFPTVPGSYQTQYKTIKRISGMFTPFTPAVKVYYGFGID